MSDETIEEVLIVEDANSDLQADSATLITEPTLRLDGVVIGVLLSFTDVGLPLVAFPGNQNKAGIAAHSTTVFKADDLGSQVALMFEGGNPKKPIVIGKIQHPEEIVQPIEKTINKKIDEERLEFNANKEMVFRCGKSSITLTKAGKIILRGAYVLSRSTGVNRIKGGSVQIN